MPVATEPRVSAPAGLVRHGTKRYVPFTTDFFSSEPVQLAGALEHVVAHWMPSRLSARLAAAGVARWGM